MKICYNSLNKYVKGKNGMTRTESREYALKLIFAFQTNHGADPEQLIEDSLDTLEEAPSDFARQLFLGVCKNIDELDAKISSAAIGWRIERISRVSLAALRLAAYELTYMPDIGVKITVNEALELVRKYEGDEAVPFVNGVLAKIIG